MKKLIVASLLTAFAMTVVAAPVFTDDAPKEGKKKGKKKKAEDKK